MTTTVNLAVGPPPQPAYIAKGSNGETIYQPNPQFWQWINLMWKWSTNFGNNANASIGGFKIGSDYIRDVADSFGLASTVTGSDDVRFWAGSTFANRATAPFRVYETGRVVGTGSFSQGGYNSSFIAIPTTASTMGYYAGPTDGSGGIFVAGGNWYGVVGSSSGTGSSGGVSGIANHATDIGVNASNPSGGVALKIAAGHIQYSGVTSTGATGTGKVVFDTSPSFTTPILGTPTSGNLANCTFPTLNQNTTGSAATLTTARNIGGTSFNGSAAIDPIQTKHAGDNSICSFTGSPGATTYPLAYTVGKAASGGGIPALNRNADDGGTMAWYWLKVWSGSQFIYMPYMA